MLGVNEMNGTLVVSVQKNGNVVWNNSGIPNLVERQRIQNVGQGCRIQARWCFTLNETERNGDLSKTFLEIKCQQLCNVQVCALKNLSNKQKYINMQ